MIFLYLIFFLLFYNWNYKYNNNNILLRPVLLLYLCGAVCAIYVYYAIAQKENNILTIGYQCLLIYLSIYPIIAYTKGNGGYVRQIEPVDQYLFKSIGWFFIVMGLLSIIHFTPAVIKVFTSGYALVDLRNNMVYNRELMVEVGIINTISGTIANFYPIIILFYFYSKCFLNNSKLFNNLLLLSSTSYILFVFSAIGRDGILFWILSFIYSYCLFLPYMTNKAKKSYKRILYIIAIIGGLGFSLITISRFMSSKGSILGEDGPIVSIIDYQGQQFNNFGQYVINVPSSYNTSSLINLFEDTSKRANFIKDGLAFKEKYGFPAWIFKGFTASFYSAMGVIGSIAFFLLYAYILGKYFRKKRTTFSKLIILTLCYQLPYLNYYYLKLSSRVGNLYIIVTLLLAYLFYTFRAARYDKTT